MKHRLVFFLFLAFLALAPREMFAVGGTICKGRTVCEASEVGVFMQGIDVSCGNVGNCGLDDILIVFANVGNFILSIVGAIVLVMYVVGGFLMLTSAGRSEYIQKGKKFLKLSTFGLVVVVFAYAGLQTINNVLRGGPTSNAIFGDYVLCDSAAPATTENKACGYNQKCDAFGICLTICEVDHAKDTTKWSCVDKANKNNAAIYNLGSCQINQCPGAESIQCCPEIKK